MKRQIGTAVLTTSLLSALLWAGLGKIIHVLIEIRDILRLVGREN